MSKLKDVVQIDGELESTRIGVGTDYTNINKDGIEYLGDATRWDDMRTSPMSAAHTGARSPVLETVANDGSVGADYSVFFSKNAYGQVTSYANMDSTDQYTVEMWIKANDSRIGALFNRDNFIEINYAYQDLKVKVDDSWTLYATDAIVVGQTQHIVVTFDYNDNRTYTKIYVNAQEVASGSMYGYQLATSTNDVFIGRKNATATYSRYEGIIDNLICYNKKLEESQVIERYNGGAGTNVLPTGITEALDVTMRFDFDEGINSTVDNNCTLGAGNDMSLYDTYTWEEGLLGITTGSLGVMALSFPPNVVTEIFGSVQFSHQYKEGSTIYPHVHWAGADTTAGDVVWKIEYLWVNIGEALQTNTTIVSRAVANDEVTAGLHRMNNIPLAGIDGTGRLISSIMQYRLYRDGTDALDTYAGKVYLSEYDVHFEIDTPAGSKTAMTK